MHSHKKGKDFWGEPVWKTLHIFAATLRPENAKSFEAYLYALPNLIPCEYCSKNLRKKLKNYPPQPYLRNNHDAFFYTYFLHDMVNQHITQLHPNDPKTSPPFDEVKTYYFHALGEECVDCQV